MADTIRSENNKTEALVKRASQGDPAAFDELVLHVSSRLCSIAHRMLAKYPQVRRWEETDDVLQAALLRLHRSLTEVKPDSVARFFGLAATQLRRILIDLSRHYYGVYGMGTKHQSNEWAAKTNNSVGLPEPVDHTEAPESLESWTAFHQAIEQLPAAEQEVFSLTWYSGLTQRQIGEALQVSERTVVRRLNRARLRLYELLADQQPSV